ncbi:LysR family transcriptional regulator [bacterium]|nr:LysR family transcriptional regulator [bacterium]
MELRQLKTFKTVAATLSFHRAAEILHYAQSTVSAQIRTLEESLGLPLFDRLGKRISLTGAGQKLLNYAERILDLEEETLTEMSDVQDSQAKLSIRMPQTLCVHYLPDILMRFKETYPRVGFDINTCAYHSLQRELKTGVIDLAFLFAEDLPVPELKSETLKTEKIILAAASGHHLARKTSIDLEDLKQETVLLPQHDCAYKMDLERSFAENKVYPKAIATLNSVEAIKNCILKRLGVGLLPELTVKNEIREGRLVELSGLAIKQEVDVIMLRHRNKWLSPVLKSFIVETRAVFGAS